LLRDSVEILGDKESQTFYRKDCVYTKTKLVMLGMYTEQPSSSTKDIPKSLNLSKAFRYPKSRHGPNATKPRYYRKMSCTRVSGGSKTNEQEEAHLYVKTMRKEDRSYKHQIATHYGLP